MRRKQSTWFYCPRALNSIETELRTEPPEEPAKPPGVVGGTEPLKREAETMKTKDGYSQHTYPYAGSPGITVIGNANGDEGGDDRIEIRTTDDIGKIWRVFVERDPDGGFAISHTEQIW